MITKLVFWVLLGGIMGWGVSRVLGTDFKGGLLAYVGVGIVAMILLGMVVKLFWMLALVAVVLVAAVWVFDYLRTR